MLLERMQAFLERRKQQGAFRTLKQYPDLVDFSSNDYLGLSRNSYLQHLVDKKASKLQLGATGSRLLSGHYDLLEELEALLCAFHKGEAALVFNSGYNANLSLMAAIPRKTDIILYDELVHASIHDGMRMSVAPSFSFAHNNTTELRQLLETHQGKTVFVIVESIYSMDGDAAPLREMVGICKEYNAYLIVDEAHSTGVCGQNGEGLCVAYGIEKDVFARVHTFGKAIGTHGAAVIGCQILKDYLINFARPLIYTTAMPPHTVLSTIENYKYLQKYGDGLIPELNEIIAFFQECIHMYGVKGLLPSKSPIQSVLVSGNDNVLNKAVTLQKAGYDARPIRKPTVEAGKERIRICLHLYNTEKEIVGLAKALSL